MTGFSNKLRWAMDIAIPSMKLKSNMSTRFHAHPHTRVRLGPSGIHIFERVSGANLLIEEIVPHRSTWAAAPRQVSIALTNACDLTCSYCFAPKVHSVLAFDRVVSWLNELDINGTIGVGFGGGEPTLYPRFDELCAYASQNTGLAITVHYSRSSPRWGPSQAAKGKCSFYPHEHGRCWRHL
jgi:sulfatase maturation enzyme AslB (radical SAM superfamily)